MPPEGSTRSLAEDLVIEEYKSLREESAQARLAQQQILQWSLASVSVLFAGGLAFLARRDDTLLIGSLVFGFGLPGFIVASSMAWYAEARRMERAGRFLRGREQAIAEADRGGSGMHPQWETKLVEDDTKIMVGYVAAAAVYTGGAAVALGVFLAELFTSNEHVPAWVRTAAIVYATAVAVGQASWLAMAARSMSRLSQDVAALEHAPAADGPSS